jgi:hypothetical protein
MTDRCVISAGATLTWDAATSGYQPSGGTVVYDGPCRVQLPDVVGRTPQFGGGEVTLQSAVVGVPIAVADVSVGDTVTVTAVGRYGDPELVGVVFTVASVPHKTDATARRLRCEEVTVVAR